MLPNAGWSCGSLPLLLVDRPDGLHDGPVRFLFTFAGGNGHFLPTLPMARSVLRRGHEVVYACQEAMVGTVEATGFTAFASGGPTLLDPSTRRPLVALDRDAERRAIQGGFAGRTARTRTLRLLEVATGWRPDVIVRDEVDFGAAVAAESLGIAHAAVVVLVAGGMLRPDLIAEPLSALRADYGLGPDPDLEMLHRYLTLVPVPRSFRDPDDPLPATAHHLRPAVLDTTAEGADTGIPLHRSEVGEPRPTLYFTLGTIFHQESGDLFTRVLGGLHDLPFQVVVTVGREIDPAELGPQPAHVRVERFLEPARLLSRCDLVVSHAGSGTVIGCLAFGVPSVLLPMGADQPLNADRCIDLGVAQVLDASSSPPDAIGRAVMTVWTDPSYRAAAARIRDEIVALPGSEHAACLLERLGRDHTPVLSG
jgi:UDP:flavonoid glycosyltransferase YjiC (YdhE family)